MASKFHFPPEGPWILEEMTDFRTGPRMNKISLRILKDQKFEGLQRLARAEQKFRNPSDEVKNETILASDQIDAKNIRLNTNLNKLNILNKLN